MTSHLAGQRPLAGKIALVTGASRRIGRAIAIALARQGVHIIVHGRISREPETLKVCGEVEGCGARSWKVFADLEKPEEYGSLIARAIQAAGSVDILVNNASLFAANRPADVGWGDIVRHLHVNAWTPFVLSREFERLARRGSIINLLDTKISGYDHAHVAYILSKQVLASLTRMCALEFAPDITVNAVAPGLILPPAGKDETYLDGLAQTVPLKRHGGPEDVTDAVLYLLSARFVTGQIIFVDGGARLPEGGNGPDSD
jgi:pteridine reductase